MVDSGAPPQGDIWDSEFDDESAVVEGARPGGQGDSAGGQTPTGANGPQTFSAYVYACLGNSYNVSPPVNEPCEEAVQACPDDALNTRPFARYTAIVFDGTGRPPAGPSWSLDRVLCITPAEAAEAQVVFTAADFRRLPLPAATPAIQPAGGEALIRMRTNVYVDPASTEQQTFDITLLGTPVQVRATPSTYTWDFGDGTAPLVTDDPGAPYPDLTTWHEYADPGQVGISLTTSYSGEYSVAGGPWIPIPGTAEVASPAQPLQLLSASSRLTG